MRYIKYKAMFIGGQEDGVTRWIKRPDESLYFIKHPKRNILPVDTKDDSHEFEEITYRLVFRTPSGVFIYEIVDQGGVDYV